MGWRSNKTDTPVRLLLLAVAGYVGGVCGIVYSNGGKWELAMLEPFSPLALMLGSLITPGAQLVCVLAATCGVGYVLIARAPRWSCVFFGAAIAATVAMTRLMWRS
jgi:hypothetical protein